MYFLTEFKICLNLTTSHFACVLTFYVIKNIKACAYLRRRDRIILKETGKLGQSSFIILQKSRDYRE